MKTGTINDVEVKSRNGDIAFTQYLRWGSKMPKVNLEGLILRADLNIKTDEKISGSVLISNLT